MRKALYVVFFIVAIIAILGITGNIPLPSSTPSPQSADSSQNPSEIPASFAISNETNRDRSMNFEKVLEEIYFYTYSPVSATQPKPEKIASVHQIYGYGVDENGEAASWSVIVRNQDQATLITYASSSDIDSYNWPGKYPEKEINLVGIIKPRELIEKNRDLIVPKTGSINTVVRELTLAEDTYYFTITEQGNSRKLIFNATTGALISSND
ncbi:MAG: hypothetical protein M0Q92_10885 [Methanoregula sp.]|jgi:hypothetical protein|nr:hypothetical protein [Methanoregula sp.]